MSKASKFQLEFIKKEKESNDAFSFYFKRPSDFLFNPGQYLKIFLKIKNPDDRGTSRYFTISSSIFEKDFLTLTTRIIKSSFKIKLFNLKPGKKIEAFGPIGYFDFDPSQNNSNIFIAGGIGITPVKSILDSINLENLKTKIYIFNSYEYFDDIIFKDFFTNLEIKNSNIKIIYLLTKDKKYKDFEKGRLNINLIRKYVTSFDNTKFFITGSEEMVNEISEKLINENVLEENIFKEDFPGY